MPGLWFDIQIFLGTQIDGGKTRAGRRKQLGNASPGWNQRPFNRVDQFETLTWIVLFIALCLNFCRVSSFPSISLTASSIMIAA
jgi:hypothetical protein